MSHDSTEATPSWQCFRVVCRPFHTPSVRTRQQPPERPGSMPIGSSGCAFANAFPSPIGASPINGSPKNCCAAERPRHKQRPFCATAVRGFHAGTPHPTITSVVHSRAPRENSKPVLFPGAIRALPAPADTPCDRARRPPLCGILTLISSPRLAAVVLPACSQTARANDNSAPSVSASRCTPSPGTRRWKPVRAPDSDIPSGKPLRI